MAGQAKMSKSIMPEEKENKETIDTSVPIITSNNLNAPKHGTVIPNRIFVGGISSATTEMDLINLFSNYGTVTGTKIIQDRAGVSKGYGFVTFETEDEAKRLQKDSDSIVLRDRRLNIAPAIKKQSFARAGYDCTAPSPVPCPNQVYRHNGFTYTFHNGMAFFPQPPPQAIPSSPHIDTSPLFPQGNNYTVGQGSPGPAYPLSFAPQGQVFYQPHQYQYHVPQYDGCYDTSQVMVADGNLVLPQYIITPQPAHEIAYYQPAPVHPQESAQSVQPIIYTSARPYDQTFIYTTEPKCGTENGLGGQNGAGIVTKEEADCSNNSTSIATVTTTSTNNNISTHNIGQNRRGRETPVISLFNTHSNIKDNNHHHSRRKNHYQSDDGRRHHHLNNNNPDTANRNLNYGQGRNGEAVECRRTPPPVSYSGGHMASTHTPNARPPPVQVPQFPYYPRQVLAPPANITSFFPPPPPAGQPLRPRSYYHKQRYQGGGGRSKSKWVAKDDEVGHPTLTPPITPRSESTTVGTTTAPPSDDVIKSMQALAI